MRKGSVHLGVSSIFWTHGMYCKTEPFSPVNIFIYFVALSFSFVVLFCFVRFIFFRLDLVPYAYHLLLRLVFLRGDKFRTLLSILFLSYSIRLKWLSIFETESILLRTSLCSESNASNSYRSFYSSRRLFSSFVEIPSNPDR